METMKIIKPDSFFAKIAGFFDTVIEYNTYVGGKRMSKKIFIVDDQDGIRMLLAEIFSNEGYHVSKASTGKEALERLTKETFHLLILDYKLPIIDGMEVVQTLEERGQTIPIVLISGLTEQIPSQHVSPLICHIVPKPFDIQHLKKLVDAILSR